MKPATALFHKEFRQQGAFALGMVLLCLIFFVGYTETQRWFSPPDFITLDFLFAIAIFTTALYAGAAAALAYSTEHADKTFTFLRRLPISPTTIALGKIGWVLCGTLLVLASNLLLFGIFALLYSPSNGTLTAEQILLTYGIGIIEVLLWGLFWSTRCREQVTAILAAYLYPALAITLLTNFVSTQGTAVDAAIEMIPYRLAILAIVGFFAVRGALRWFDFDAYTQSPERTLRRFRIYRYGLCERFLRYPQKIQSPFLALVHQHLRHASILYPFGILCFALFSLGSLWLFVQPDNLARYAFINKWWFPVGAIISAGGIVIFWGTIFGHDQKNDSYRFLSRLGIHEGKVWRSRMLLPLLLYIPVFVCFAAYMAADVMEMGFSRHEPGTPEYQRIYESNIQQVFTALPVLFTVWLAPAALGAFLSISLRSQMVSIVLTFAGTVVIFFWAMLFLWFFGFSAWWTTVPILVALLLASRIRAGYWLRETFTWRSRLLPLAPVFATILAILVAVPPVRVYTIPYVSWEQITAYLDEADLPVRLSPEKRSAMLQFMKDGTDSPEYRFRERFENPWGVDSYPEWNDLSDDRQIMRRQLEFRKQALEDSLSIEELMFHSYYGMYDYLQRLEKTQLEKGDDEYREQRLFMFIKRFMPWELARLERAARVHLVWTLVETGDVRDERALSVKRWRESRDHRVHNDFLLDIYWGGGLITDISAWGRAVTEDFPPIVRQWRNLQCRYHLHIVFAAINCYYWEHDRTLPESLEDLVGTYLDALPVQPLTGEPVEYHRNFEPSEGFFKSRSIRVAHLGTAPFSQWSSYQRQNDGTFYYTVYHSDGSSEMVECSTDVFIILGNQAFAVFEPEEITRWPK